MTTMKRLLALLTALCLCLALCACNSAEEQPDPSQSPSPSDSAAPTQSADPGAEESPAIEADLSQTLYEFSSGLKDEDTAITVNGTAVPNEMFLYWLSYNCYYIQYYYYQMGVNVDFSNEETAAFLLEDTQTLVAYYEVLRQMCAEKGITLSPEQEEDYASLYEQLLASYNNDEALLLQGFGLSAQSLETLYKNDYYYANYANQAIPEPTEEELNEYVETNGIFGVKHILLMTATENEDGTIALLDGSAPLGEDGEPFTGTAEEFNAMKLAKAEDLLAQLQAAENLEELFDQLMKEYSEDGGVATNPDGYTFTNEDSLVGGFREATLELEVGGMSGIVETDYGYHIMLRLPVDASSFRETVLSQKVNEAVAARAEVAEITMSEELAALDVADFYNRYMAYGVAFGTYLQEQTAAEG